MEIVAVSIFVALSLALLYVSSQSIKLALEFKKDKRVFDALFSLFVTIIMFVNIAFAIHYIIRICKEGIT